MLDAELVVERPGTVPELDGVDARVVVAEVPLRPGIGTQGWQAIARPPRARTRSVNRLS